MLLAWYPSRWRHVARCGRGSQLIAIAMAMSCWLEASASGPIAGVLRIVLAGQWWKVLSTFTGDVAALTTLSADDIICAN